MRWKKADAAGDLAGVGAKAKKMKNIKEKKIVVVGVSHKPEKYGYRIFSDLVKAGFNVEGINPTGGEISGKKIYRNLKELSFIPDLIITVVPPVITEKIVDECRELGVSEIWMQPGSESEEAIKKAREHGISVVHNACFMVKQGIW
jgi:uncharacterized protein